MYQIRPRADLICNTGAPMFESLSTIFRDHGHVHASEILGNVP